uniref:Uncharacterized protein n=1 Tax=Lepeophtheirus salmonis TaxID=72036 RepID=A0A0K2TRL9_LEPSM
MLLSEQELGFYTYQNHKKLPVSDFVYIVTSNNVKIVDAIHNVIVYY